MIKSNSEVSSYFKLDLFKVQRALCVRLFSDAAKLLKVAAAQCAHILKYLVRVPIPPFKGEQVLYQLVVKALADDPAGIARGDAAGGISFATTEKRY